MPNKFNFRKNYIALLALASVLSAGLLLASIAFVYRGNPTGIQGTHANFPQELLLFRAFIFIFIFTCFLISFMNSKKMHLLSFSLLCSSIFVYGYWRRASKQFLEDNNLSSPPDFLGYIYELRAASQLDGLVLLLIVVCLFYLGVRLVNYHRGVVENSL